MDNAKPRLQEHDVLILRTGQRQTVCTCDGNIPQLDGESVVPTCTKCGGRIIKLE